MFSSYCVLLYPSWYFLCTKRADCGKIWLNKDDFSTLKRFLFVIVKTNPFARETLNFLKLLGRVTLGYLLKNSMNLRVNMNSFLIPAHPLLKYLCLIEYVHNRFFCCKFAFKCLDQELVICDTDPLHAFKKYRKSGIMKLFSV